MSKRARGQNVIVPQHSWNVDTHSDEHRDVRRDPGGILLERIEEQTVDRERKHRYDQVVHLEDHGLSACVEYIQSVGCDGAYIYEIATRQQHQQIDDGSDVDDVVERMRRANTHAAAIHIGSRDKKIAGIELKDGNYVKAYEKCRSHYYRQHKERQDFVKRLVTRKHGQTEQYVESALSDVVPVSVPIKMNDAQSSHGHADAHSVDDQRCQDDGQARQALLHFSTMKRHNQIILLNRLTWHCGFADCPAPTLPHCTSETLRAKTRTIRKHYKLCHAAEDVSMQLALALIQRADRHIIDIWTCSVCGKVFSSLVAHDEHRRLCK